MAIECNSVQEYLIRGPNLLVQSTVCPEFVFEPFQNIPFSRHIAQDNSATMGLC